MKTFLNNFTSGEWTPFLDGRVDYERYENACRKLENFTVLPYGGAQFRNGLDFVAGIPAASILGGQNLDQARIVPFVFSNDVKFIIAFVFGFGDSEFAPPNAQPAFNIVVYDKNGARAASLGGPWTADINLLRTRQINDVMYLAHPNFPVQKLTRQADGWHLDELLFDNPPMLDENTDEESRIWFTRDVVDGVARPMTGTITANKIRFNRGHIGSYWTLKYRNNANYINRTLNYSGGAPSEQVASYFKQTAISWAWFHGSGIGFWAIKWSSPELISEVEYNQLKGGEFKNPQMASYSRSPEPTADSYTLFVKNASVYVSDPIYVRGDWALSTTGYWWGELQVQRSFDNGATWQIYRKYDGQSDRTVGVSGSEPDLCMMRMRYVGYGDPFDSKVWNGGKPSYYSNPNARLEFSDSYADGVVRITALAGDDGNITMENDAGGAMVDVIRDVIVSGPNIEGGFVVPDEDMDGFDDNSTDLWSEGAWSFARGFPASTGLFEQRLFFAGTSGRPNTIWASASDDFENFRLGHGEGDAFTITLAATEQNGIAWLESLRRLHAATVSRNFSVVGGESTGTPLSAANFLVRSENMRGAEPIAPALMDDSLVFVGRKGKSVYEMAYDVQTDSYSTQEISLLAPHLLVSGARQIAYFANPHGCFYCVLGDGTMAVFTYMPNERVSAWSRWRLGGGRKFTSVCVLPGAETDDLWCVVDGNLLCRLGGGFLDTAVTAVAVDENGATLPAVSHFADGSKVDCVVNGTKHLRGCVVSAKTSQFGALPVTVAFPEPVENAVSCVAGLPYKGVLQPMKLEAVLQSGPSAGQMRRVSKVVGRFYETVSCKTGESEDRLCDVDFRNTRDRMDSVQPPFTGDAPLSWAGGNSRDAGIVLVNDEPFACTVLGLAVSWEVFG